MYKKADYEAMVRARIIAFTRIASELGEDHQITKMMGSLAWGRHGAEYGPGGGLKDAVEAFGFLNGFFACLNLWARDNDRKAQKMMLDNYPRGMEVAENIHS